MFKVETGSQLTLQQLKAAVDSALVQFPPDTKVWGLGPTDGYVPITGYQICDWETPEEISYEARRFREHWTTFDTDVRSNQRQDDQGGTWVRMAEKQFLLR